MNKFTIRTYSILLVFLVLGLLFSCVPMKKVRYFQENLEKDDSSKVEFENQYIFDYKIQPGDHIYIRVNSLDPQTNDFFNNQSESRGYTNQNDIGIYLNSYSVSDSGFIDFPYVGKIFIKDLTVEQTKDILQNILAEYVKDVTVIVKLVNYNITMLGEFMRPGEYKIYQNRITILEAISLAGDGTRYADKTNVVLVRKEGKKTRLQTLDLTQRDILASEYYYLRPNDMIYMPPIKGRNFVFADFPYTLILGIITTALVIGTYFK